MQVGSEWVTKGQNVDQAYNAVAGIARATFERQFRYVKKMRISDSVNVKHFFISFVSRYLVAKCNDTLVDPSMRK